MQHESMAVAAPMTPLFPADRREVARPGSLAVSVIYDDPRDDEAGWFEDGPEPGPVRRVVDAVVGTSLGLVWAGGLALIALLVERLPGFLSRRQ